VWDAENRLKTVKDAAGNVLVTYTYDAQSRRIRTTDAAGPRLEVYDGWNRVAEYELLNAQPTTLNLKRSFTWGLDLSGTLQGAGGVGGLLMTTHAPGTATAASFTPTYDGNGNISEYLAASGTTVAHLEYDPFGNLLPGTWGAEPFDHRFSTKPQDAVTGMYYYGYRGYDPVTGRWPSRDPIAETGGENLYGMLDNHLTNATDYIGLDQMEWQNIAGPLPYHQQAVERTRTVKVTQYRRNPCCERGAAYNEVQKGVRTKYAVLQGLGTKQSIVDTRKLALEIAGGFIGGLGGKVGKVGVWLIDAAKLGHEVNKKFGELGGQKYEGYRWVPSAEDTNQIATVGKPVPQLTYQTSWIKAECSKLPFDGRLEKVEETGGWTPWRDDK